MTPHSESITSLLSELKEMETNATKGTWQADMVSGLVPDKREIVLDDGFHNPFASFDYSADADLVIDLRNSAPLLLALGEEGLKMREALKKCKTAPCGHCGRGEAETWSIAKQALSSFDKALAPFLKKE